MTAQNKSQGRNGGPLSWVLSSILLGLIVVNLGFQYAINVWNRSIFDALKRREAVTVFHMTAISDIDLIKRRTRIA